MKKKTALDLKATINKYKSNKMFVKHFDYPPSSPTVFTHYHPTKAEGNVSLTFAPITPKINTGNQIYSS